MVRDPKQKPKHHLAHFLPESERERFDAKAKGHLDSYRRIDESNKGHQMLKKLGWEEGENHLGLSFFFR